MLTLDEQLLIASAVDGPLPTDSARKLRQLLNEKPAAARLLDQLKADAERVRVLPQPRLPQRVTLAILAQVADQKSRPRRAVTPVSRIWLPYAVAASVLLAIGTASFWFYSQPQDRPAEEQLAKRLPRHKQLPSHRLKPLDSDYLVATPPTLTTPALPTREEISPPREPIVVVQAPPRTELAPTPRPAEGDLVGFGIIETPRPLTAIDLNLPFITRVSQLGTAEVQQKFADMTASSQALRINLFADSLAQGHETVQKALMALKVNTLVDATAHERINKNHPIALGVVIEGLTPEEVQRLLATLSKLDATAKTPNLTQAHLVPLSPADHREVKDLIGADLGWIRAPRAEAPQPQSIASGTLDRVTSSIKKVEARQALTMTYLPNHLRTAAHLSREAKKFLDRRGPVQPGTLPVILVIR
jgi:hypothetical protein